MLTSLSPFFVSPSGFSFCLISSLSQLVDEGDTAFIGVCQASYNVDEPPFLQGAHSVNSQGFLYHDGEFVVRFHDKFRSGDIIEISLGQAGDRFDWAVNGQPQPAVANIPRDGRVIAVGGSGSRWRMA